MPIYYKSEATSKCHAVDRGRAHKASPVTEEVLAAGSCWGKVTHASTVVWPHSLSCSEDCVQSQKWEGDLLGENLGGVRGGNEVGIIFHLLHVLKRKIHQVSCYFFHDRDHLSRCTSTCSFTCITNVSTWLILSLHAGSVSLL